MSKEEELEVIFETVDPAEVIVIKSLLEGACVRYLVLGEDQYDAFRGAFRGTVFNPNGRPVVFKVPASQAEDARQLLKEIEFPDKDA